MRTALVIGIGLQVDNLKDFEKALKLLADGEVLVGVPDSKADRRDVKSEPINNAQLAYIHDKGSPAANIPARPFMQPGVESKKEDIQKHLLKAGELVLEGKSPDSELNAAGLVAQAGIRAVINSNLPPPLAKSTLAARKRRGVIRTNTLLDTAQLRNAINYVVRKKEA